MQAAARENSLQAAARENSLRYSLHPKSSFDKVFAFHHQIHYFELW